MLMGLQESRFSERSDVALFLPLVFAANIVLATLAWIIVGAVMRQRPAAFERAVMEERHVGTNEG
jgi:hypothetical protein